MLDAICQIYTYIYIVAYGNMPHIYRCKQDAICRIYIFIYRCIWQYAKHISLQAGGNMPGADNICVRILPLDLVHILPNNLPQFGILSSLCAICRSREYMCEIIGILNNFFCCIAYHTPATIFPILQYAIYAIC